MKNVSLVYILYILIIILINFSENEARKIMFLDCMKQHHTFLDCDEKLRGNFFLFYLKIL